MQQQCTDFVLLIHEKELLVKRKLERLKFTNEKQKKVDLEVTKLMMETIIVILT